ncbi:hypothetical protein MZK47_13335 [Microbacterium aerolatum]|uniref:hypothetical protein n=1 Tax=Microbacterium aerolatum TaxID=153731 RepID=UPI0020011698|nr:hypothetical protein [Microbacterium aerolatum]MCK3770656.1 hypothetical protein [Microbacterium aerolatum]
MLRRLIELRVDRDSVAMGDDVVSHAAVMSVPHGTLLSAALEQSSPEIRSPGWSWVAVVDRETAAVWSVDHGVQLLVEDRKLNRGPVEIFFRYFVQIDPAWLFDRLAQGAKADRRVLEAEYAPIATEKYRAELRRREREIDERFLSSDCVDALRHYGADITLHADMACDFIHEGETWAVRRADTMFQVFRGGGGPIASIRPHALGEAWLVAMVGSRMRTEGGQASLPDIAPIRGLELTRSGGRWMSHGATVVQVRSDHQADVARFAYGRTITEVRKLLDA